jgi:hypothetical protein
MFSFERLEVWQKAIAFARDLINLIPKFPSAREMNFFVIDHQPSTIAYPLKHR